MKKNKIQIKLIKSSIGYNVIRIVMPEVEYCIFAGGFNPPGRQCYSDLWPVSRHYSLPNLPKWKNTSLSSKGLLGDDHL